MVKGAWTGASAAERLAIAGFVPSLKPAGACCCAMLAPAQSRDAMVTAATEKEIFITTPVSSPCRASRSRRGHYESPRSIRDFGAENPALRTDCQRGVLDDPARLFVLPPILVKHALAADQMHVHVGIGHHIA